MWIEAYTYARLGLELGIIMLMVSFRDDQDGLGQSQTAKYEYAEIDA